MSSDRRALAISAVTALVVVGLLNQVGNAWVADRAARALDASVDRASNVIPFEKGPALTPEPRAGRQFLLIGNSHTYALPALEAGQPLRPDPGATLIDELAKRGPKDATYYRLAYPNLLPFEMLTRVAHLYAKGYRPETVVIGLTWRNVARDTELRRQVQDTFAEPGFGEALLAQVKEEPIKKRIRAEIKEAARRAELERTKSAADRLDETLTAAVGDHVALVGKSRGLRVKLYRAVNVAVTGQLAEKEGFQYSLVKADLAFNLLCLQALLSMLEAHGAKVILYRAPERSDLSPLIDPAQQDPTYQRLGQPLLDARSVVPNAHWGWAYDQPDRSHFTEPGHQRLADFIVRSRPEAFR